MDPETVPPNTVRPNDESPTAPPADPLTGHEYDGIAEYDNPMPAWWVRIFWATFVFSLGYYVHYQLTGNGASVEETYAAEMQEHREKLAAASLGQQIDEFPDGLERAKDRTNYVVLKTESMLENVDALGALEQSYREEVGQEVSDELARLTGADVADVAVDTVGPSWGKQISDKAQTALIVFLLAILVSLVKLGELATVLPGRGLFAFTAVVVLTILASTSFDPAQIWETPEEHE